MAVGYDLKREEIEEDTMKGRFLTFSLGEESYAVSIKYVIEINRVLEITPMPDFPSYLEGITNLRGKIVPIMNIRKRIGLPTVDYTETTCFMILSMNDNPFGLIVDSISEVISIAEEDITPPPMEDSVVSRYIDGVAKVNDKIVLIIDCETIFAG